MFSRNEEANGGGIWEDGGEIIKKEKARNLIERIKMYRELALTAREAGAYVGGSAVTWWRHGDEEMVEWSERKGDQLYSIVDFYEREAVKATDQLYELIRSLDVSLDLPINWRDAALLGPPWLRLL